MYYSLFFKKTCYVYAEKTIRNDFFAGYLVAFFLEASFFSDFLSHPTHMSPPLSINSWQKILLLEDKLLTIVKTHPQ